jgi:hypothetical protein
MLVVNLGGGVQLEMAWIPPGEFTMGCSAKDPLRVPQRRTAIRDGFWLGRYEVTQRQWAHVMGTNPSLRKGDNLPVDSVTWNNAVSFAETLESKIGQLHGIQMRFRLPKESEWEYACRAGTTSPYAGNIDEFGWYRDNSEGTTHEVGLMKANQWGLHDMHGNLCEWCNDKSEYTRNCRVVRGGSIYSTADQCRSDWPDSALPDLGGYEGIGLRIAADGQPRAVPASWRKRVPDSKIAPAVASRLATAEMRRVCIQHLRIIDAAKNQWEMENDAASGVSPTRDQLLPIMRTGGQWPACPAVGVYTINPIGKGPTCSVSGHALD